MGAWVRVITYSEFNHLIYTIRSSIRNQSHISRSRTQQEQLTSSLVSAPLIPSDTCTLILTTSIFLFLVFSHPRLLPNRVKCIWDESSLHMKEFSKVLGLLDICRERYNALTKMGSTSLDSIIMCSKRNVDKCNDSDQVFCGRRLRPVWGSIKGNWDKKLCIFRPSLYLHVSSANYDGCPVMIDRMSTSKYQRLRSTIAH